MNFGAQTNFPFLVPLPRLLSLPSSPLPLEVGPLKCSREVWGALRGLGLEFDASSPQNLTSGGNISKDFPENQLAIFRAV